MASPPAGEKVPSLGVSAVTSVGPENMGSSPVSSGSDSLAGVGELLKQNCGPEPTGAKTWGPRPLLFLNKSTLSQLSPPGFAA